MQRSKSDFLNDHQKEQIESLAEYVADYFSPKGAVNVEAIADSSNISYSYGNYGDTFDGLLEHEYGNFHVYLNNDRLDHPYTERARFTFGHELGHYYIDHHRNALASGLAPSHSSITGFVSDNLIEREADFFASCLLLPRNRLKLDCLRRKFDFKLLQELSKKYQTSMTATALRYATLGFSPIMVIYSVNNAVKWYWYTHDFPFWSLKHGKQLVPENTAAGEYFTKNAKYNSSEIVFADDWFSVKFERDLERQFYEHCIYGKDSNVISIIWEK